MSRSFTEAPIPPYGVTVESDGCHVGNVGLPEAWGTREQCAQWIADHLPPHGCDFGIVCIDTGRQVSFMIPPSSKRPVRLKLDQLKLED